MFSETVGIFLGRVKVKGTLAEEQRGYELYIEVVDCGNGLMSMTI